MKTYRLIKTYPGSPKLGTILTHEELQFCNWNEYYQEVIEKDYEILSLARLCTIKPTITDVSDYGDGYIEALLKCDKARIHSVKRNDGEIFTIGDRLDEKCFRKLSRHSLSEGIHDNIITKIAIVKEHASEVAGHLEIQNGKLMFSASNKWNNLNVLLSEAIKYKQPLFTTEDGVDIFEGDTFYYVKFKENRNSYGRVFEIVIADRPGCIYEPQYEKYFSTKEKAEEYILMNKPVLSLNDIFKDVEEMRKGLKTFENSQLAKRFKKLVQQKLKSC